MTDFELKANCLHLYMKEMKEAWCHPASTWVALSFSVLFWNSFLQFVTILVCMAWWRRAWFFEVSVFYLFCIFFFHWGSCICDPLQFIIVLEFSLPKQQRLKKKKKHCTMLHLFFLHSIKLSTSSKARELREAPAFEGMSSSPKH